MWRRLRRRLKCPRWLYRWVDGRGWIPSWVRWIWPCTHWCDEMDGLLIIDNVYDCFCGACTKEKDERCGYHDNDEPLPF